MSVESALWAGVAVLGLSQYLIGVAALPAGGWTVVRLSPSLLLWLVGYIRADVLISTEQSHD